MAHGNDTENTSFLDVIFALRQNVMRTINTSDLYIVRQIHTKEGIIPIPVGIYLCESLTNADTKIDCIKLQGLELKTGDVVLVTFTSHDFRASLRAYKNGDANTNSETQSFHDKLYGIITGIVYRKGE